MASRPRVVFCTAAGGSYGFGHLKRCLSIVDAGRRLFDGKLLLSGGTGLAATAGSGLAEGHRVLTDWSEVGEIDLIVSDQRDTSPKEMFGLTARAPVIALDDREGGRVHAHVSIHSLPTTEGFSGNFTGLEYIVLDPGFRRAGRGVKPGDAVVVSMGGSDPHDLTGSALRALNRIGIRPIIVRGPLFSHEPPDGSYELLDNPKDMVGVLSRAGVVVTAFGMTLFESLYLGRPVVVLNHSAYHDELARTIPGLTILGHHGHMTEAKLAGRLSAALSEREKLESAAANLSDLVDARGLERVVGVIEKALRGGRNHCLFRHGRYVALRREHWGSLMACRVCGDLFQFELDPVSNRYSDREYFFSEYEGQYGRTYIEDRDRISAAGAGRLQVIEEVLAKRGGAGQGAVLEKGRAPRAPGRVLDVGCALGFFLDVARKRGWDTRGVEVSSYAAEWARQNLGLDVSEASFLETELAPESFDAVTLFFVAEHFKDVEKVIERAYTLLRRGGVLACALPNRGGISYRRNREVYLEGHPRDHFIDTCPRNLIRCLKGFGFEKRRIRVTGIHPERFLSRRIAPFDALYETLSRVLRLGDTFEYYGIKT
jgi:SAM-dependent methyltransferase